MINRVVLVGRLTKDIEIRKTTNGISVVRFNLACDRPMSKEQKEKADVTADFISCQAWRSSADFLGKYAHKGDVVAVDGHITTGSYEGQNGRVYTTDVTCESVRLISSSNNQQQSSNSNQSYSTPANSNQSYQQAPKHTRYEEQSLYQAPNTSGQYSSSYDDEFNNTPSLDISSDDLPFY